MNYLTAYTSYSVGRFRVHWLAVVFLLQLAGCSSIGPPTVKRDRFDYVVAISDSYKRQTLLNLVKTRYMDVPVFMDVDSVISQYAIEGELGFELAPSLSENNLLLGNGKYTDRPTITYSPLTGEKYSRNLLKPLALSSIFLLLQSGYPVDGIFGVCVQSINNIENRRSGTLASNGADPRFVQALSLMRELQSIAILYYRVGFSPNKGDVKLGFREVTTPEATKKVNELKRLLGLDPSLSEFNIVFGMQSRNKNEIALLSRSMMQIMIEYAADIEVPQSDVEEGRVMRTVSDSIATPLIRIHNGVTEPDDKHVTVFYRDKWYWVDDTDIYSKATFQFLMVLFSLTERGAANNLAPVITVPTY